MTRKASKLDFYHLPHLPLRQFFNVKDGCKDGVPSGGTVLFCTRDVEGLGIEVLWQRIQDGDWSVHQVLEYGVLVYQGQQFASNEEGTSGGITCKSEKGSSSVLGASSFISMSGTCVVDILCHCIKTDLREHCLQGNQRVEMNSLSELEEGSRDSVVPSDLFLTMSLAQRS